MLWFVLPNNYEAINPFIPVYPLIVFFIFTLQGRIISGLIFRFINRECDLAYEILL